MEKINFKNKGETGAVPLNAENLNLLQTNVEESINNSKIQLKSTKTESNDAGYNCNYINSLMNGCYTCAFSGKTNVNIFSRSNYDNCLIISSTYISILKMEGTNDPIIRDVYGTHAFSTAFDGTKMVVSDLYNWDRYIILGSNGVTKIE